MAAHNLLHQLSLAPYEIVDPGQGGTIQVDRAFMYVPLISTEAETSAALRRALPNPARAGLVLILSMHTDGGDIGVYNAVGFDQSDTTTITFDNAGDWTMLHSMNVGGTLKWRVIAGEGA